ncbi:ADP-ribosylation factor protein 1, partial [Cichlidogyrus casuarinus]
KDFVYYKRYHVFMPFTCSDLRRACLILVGLSTLQSWGFLQSAASEAYSSIINFHDKSILNSHTIFLLQLAAFMGFMFVFYATVLNKWTLNFHIVGDSERDFRMIQLSHLVAEKMLFSTIGRIIIFIPIYLVFSGLLEIIPSFRGLTFFWIMINIRLLILMFLIAFHVHFSWGCCLSILKYNLSQ